MAVFSRIKTWVSNEVLTASDLNAEINNLLNNTIPASIEDYSVDVSTMQTTADPGGLSTESLATTLAGELTRLRYAIKRIAGSSQWYVAPVSTLGTAGIVKTSLAALGQQVSNSSGSYTTTSTSLVDVTNLTVTITTTGRPVFIGLVADGTANDSYLGVNGAGASDVWQGFFYILEGATNICRFAMSFQAETASAANNSVNVPLSSLFHIYVPSAGTYTYKVQAKVIAGTVANIAFSKLIAYEL